MDKPLAKPRYLLLGTFSSIALSLAMRGAGIDPVIANTAAITTLTAIWWITEALPIPATSLVPFAAFPLFGVVGHDEAAAGLGNSTIMLLMGGFMMAKGLEKSGVHRRLALGILRAVGARGGKRIVFAFMLAAAALSMWISNTSTALILMPIALAVLGHLNDDRLNSPVILGVAYACSLGGVATLIGTPPNIIFAGIYESIAGEEFSFVEWMRVGFPIVLIGLPLVALWLTRRVQDTGAITLPESGEWRPEERRVLVVFVFAILFWVFRTEPFGGWSQLVRAPFAGDATVALTAVIVMFLVPSGKGDQLLSWKWAAEIPWGILLMFASGITIANAFQSSGLALLIGEAMASHIDLPPYLLILAICLSVSFLTEVTSNTATATLLMPIMGATAVAFGLPPAVLMIPAAISASCAFMLPVATPANAIAYGTDKISTREMAREGIVLNLILAVVVSLVCYLML